MFVYISVFESVTCLPDSKLKATTANQYVCPVPRLSSGRVLCAATYYATTVTNVLCVSKIALRKMFCGVVVVVVCFESRSHYVSMAGLELTRICLCCD